MTSMLPLNHGQDQVCNINVQNGYNSTLIALKVVRVICDVQNKKDRSVLLTDG